MTNSRSWIPSLFVFDQLECNQNNAQFNVQLLEVIRLIVK